jgi:hypothetical protein
MTMTEFGSGNGRMNSRSPSMNCRKVVVQNDPSTTLQWRIPSLREIAGSTENLEMILY